MGIFDWLRGKPAAAGTAPEELFVRDIEARLKRNAQVTSAARIPDDPMALRVTANGTTMTMYLGNLFAETRELDPERKEAQVERHLRGAIEPRPHPTTWADAEPHVALALRGPFVVNADTGQPTDLAAREVVPCLREHLVLDSADNIAFIRSDELAAWSISYEAAADVARARLARAPSGEVLYDKSKRIWTVDADDDYESARLLAPGFLRSFAGRVDGAPVAIVPTRNQVFVAGDADPTVVSRLVEMASREFSASQRRVSSALYSIDAAGLLCRYLRAGGDDCAKEVQLAHVQFEGGEYDQQKQALDPQFAAAGTDLFVATFSGIVHPRRGALSYCTWTPGIVSLLPRTDLVAVTGPSGEMLLVPWEAVRNVVGMKLQVERGHYPVRWRTVGDPDAADREGFAANAFRPDG